MNRDDLNKNRYINIGDNRTSQQEIHGVQQQESPLGSRYSIQFNNENPQDLMTFIKAPILPEVINTLKIDFRAGKDENLNLITLIMLLEVLIDKNRVETEYSTLLSSMINSMIIVKKLEAEAQLDDYRY